jgi:branched-chain amino acid transport system substrate-binding protein
MADLVKSKLGIKHLAILYANNSSGVGAKDAMVKGFESMGRKVVAIESIEDNFTDARTQLVRIRNANPEAIYVAAFTKDAARVMKQARELALKTQWLSWDIEGEDVIKIAGKAANGLIISSTALDTMNPKDSVVNKFVYAYKQKYNEIPDIYAANAYDGIKIFAKAIAEAGNDGPSIKQYLSSLRDYPGAGGNTTFDKDGMVQKPVLFKRFNGTQFMTFQE